MYKLEIITSQRDKLLATLEQLTNNMDDTTHKYACKLLFDIKKEMAGEGVEWQRPEILTGVASHQMLWKLLENENDWDNPDYRLKGCHWEGPKWIAWDNSTGHCNVENFKTEEQAMAFLNDEEL